jgi:hypothetical protein
MWTLPRTLRNISRRFLGYVQPPQRSGPEKRSCLLVEPGLLARQDRWVSVETAMAYLYNQVGERRIALSDILFTIDEKLESG